jgi:hypothetical protein
MASCSCQHGHELTVSSGGFQSGDSDVAGTHARQGTVRLDADDHSVAALLPNGGQSVATGEAEQRPGRCYRGIGANRGHE